MQISRKSCLMRLCITAAWQQGSNVLLQTQPQTMIGLALFIQNVYVFTQKLSQYNLEQILMNADRCSQTTKWVVRVNIFSSLTNLHYIINLWLKCLSRLSSPDICGNGAPGPRTDGQPLIKALERWCIERLCTEKP